MQRCEPGVAAGAYESETVFGHRGGKAVSTAEYDGEGEIHSTTCIGFEDYARMNTQTRKGSIGSRRIATPTWAVNHTELQALLVRFFERRAWNGKLHSGTGSAIQRLNEAHRVMLAKIPAQVAVIDKLCREYVEVRNTDPARARLLQSQIQNLDMCIRMAKMGPGAVARIVVLYYSVGCDSVGVASEIGIHPVLVRQTLHRLHKVASTPDKPSKPPKPKPPKPPATRLCAVCGKEFPAVHHWKVCSPECQRENVLRRERRYREERMKLSRQEQP